MARVIGLCRCGPFLLREQIIREAINLMTQNATVKAGTGFELPPEKGPALRPVVRALGVLTAL